MQLSAVAPSQVEYLFVVKNLDTGYTKTTASMDAGGRLFSVGLENLPPGHYETTLRPDPSSTSIPSRSEPFIRQVSFSVVASQEDSIPSEPPVTNPPTGSQQVIPIYFVSKDHRSFFREWRPMDTPETALRQLFAGQSISDSVDQKLWGKVRFESIVRSESSIQVRVSATVKFSSLGEAEMKAFTAVSATANGYYNTKLPFIITIASADGSTTTLPLIEYPKIKFSATTTISSPTQKFGVTSPVVVIAGVEEKHDTATWYVTNGVTNQTLM